jgi:hypothetical protein
MSCTYCTGFVTDATLLVSVVFRDEVRALIGSPDGYRPDLRGEPHHHRSAEGLLEPVRFTKP